MGIWPNAEWTLFGAFKFATQKDKKAAKEEKKKDAKSRKRKA